MTSDSFDKIEFRLRIISRHVFVIDDSLKMLDKVMEAEKPVELLESIIEYISLPDELLLDQFGGSGNFAIACTNTKRNSIVIEKSEEMFAKMKENVEENLQKTDGKLDVCYMKGTSGMLPKAFDFQPKETPL